MNDPRPVQRFARPDRALAKAVEASRAPAISRAAAVLRLLGRSDTPLGVHAIARELGLVPSTCLNVLRALVAEELVSFDPDTKRYALEAGVLTLARHWLHHGAKLVVVTRGAEGAVGYTADHKVTVPSERVTVVDTVGAGDTFDAGVLASLKMQNLLTKQQVARLSEDQIANALALGAKAAAVTVSRAGANPPWAKEIGLA